MANRLYDESGMRELDRRAMARPGVGGGALMERAGAALLQALEETFPDARRLGVLCGPGNNGGDGYVLARLAGASGWTVKVHGSAGGTGTASDGTRAAEAWRAVGGSVDPLEDFAPEAADVWADCLFGIGLGRPIDGALAALIEHLNATGRPVLAADVPSGIDVNTGSVQGVAVRAALTVTMIADKLGLHTGPAVDYVGAVRVAGLDVPDEVFRDIPFAAVRWRPEAVSRWLPVRRPGAHKGNCGHVVVIGGAPGYSGAGRLAGMAALRAGAGRVTLVTHPEHAALANLERPELMVRPAESARDLQTLLAGADAVAVGPGLGQQAWGRALWPAVADWTGPLVVDADALNLLAQAPRRRDDWVLTPHPGEAARLLAVTTGEVTADRVAAVDAIRRRFGGVVLLKGAGTLVAPAPGGGMACITGGHPGMASAGMGDVLTGVMAALRAQGLGPGEAAAAGAAWHVAAARLAARRIGAERGMLAGDVIDALPQSGAGGGS
ncbi:bifunctional ADP-dependent NAD(P)H-hydrate dehydratase/NAD(P)H-hydrate epimerase [Thioalkalivibrio nitratireducens]|uniref:bifunctional ADP-dependent NAD(P)H-hydrate dehydratase/NAD(P)H-hydrate epimerase n=1 Tax=Thioalkalivibrio nitratireducens TaxID=186931 RepID=UPI0005C148C4|nr:bifunctional ADP-dependent NAD(P)H-hydrate dehydratase/NAD(P)H-hydrate epimerase [Thioalkalivibrio nitratireducens]